MIKQLSTIYLISLVLIGLQAFWDRTLNNEPRYVGDDREGGLNIDELIT